MCSINEIKGEIFNTIFYMPINERANNAYTLYLIP